MFSLKVHALEHPSEETLDAMLNSKLALENGTATATPTTASVVEAATKDGGTKGEDDDEGDGDGSTEKPDDGTRTIAFSSGNPRVEATRGVMHLYRDTASEPGSLEKLPAGRSERLCVLAVPNHMTGADFCQFTGAFIQNIKEMRFVRNDGQTERYSVLMTFDSQQLADDFYLHYNLKPFSSLEAEVCHVLYTADVQFTESAEQASTPPSGLTELPTCPVCLERLDQHISGILTTVCNHSFHSTCISKWTDSSCPVCRYCQQQSEKSTCSVCGTSENLWICVICGFVGCGRYKERHAWMHWQESQHCYSLDLETQRVWDYVGDGYVHRLIQSKTDGKLVELPAPCRDGGDDCCNCGAHSQGVESAIYNSKLDAIDAEYDHLLTTLLESQRQYYEGRLTELEEERELTVQQAVEAAVSLKLRKLQVRFEKGERESRDLQELNRSLIENQKVYQQRLKELEERDEKVIKEKDEKIADLEEQVRDFMVFIEAQKMLETSANGAEIRDGSVLVLPATPTPSKPSSRTLRSGKKKK